jgi:peptidylprolyl isomerase
MRRAAALVITPLLAALALAGCGSSSSSNAAASDTYKSVTATGTFGKAPTVKIPAEQGSGALYTKTVIQGSGAALTSSQGMIGNYVAYDWSGKTHKLLGSSYTSGKPSLFTGTLLPGLKTALVGQKIGSRVLAVIPPKDGFGTSGNSNAGIGKTDTLVFVVDMISAFDNNGVSGAQSTNGGGSLPTVTAPASGSTAGPTITIPAKVTAPKTLQVKTLIKGTGAKVTKGETLAVQYTGVNWRTGKVFDSSWARNSPYTVVIGAGQVIKGWDTGLVGQTVGSRVLLVIPPADGYGKAGASAAGIKGTDTLVFVVDILAAD